MKRLIALYITLFFSLLAVSAPHPNHGQKARIVHGYHQGSLSKQEVIKLSKEQKKIRRMEKAAVRDGVITYRERKILNEANRKASRHIKREKLDRNRY